MTSSSTPAAALQSFEIYSADKVNPTLLGIIQCSSIVGATAIYARQHGISSFGLVAQRMERTAPRTGDEVTDEQGRRGIVADDYVKRSGQHKGQIEVLWIGARYGVTSADPRTLTVIGRTA